VVDMTLRVAFRWSPPGYLTGPNFFTELVAMAANCQVSVEPISSDRADLVFESVQLPLWLRTRAELANRRYRMKVPRIFGDGTRGVAHAPSLNSGPATVWFTGENVRPPSSGYAGTLSFDTDSYEETNAYLPLWIEASGLLGPPSWDFGADLPPFEQFIQGRPTSPARGRRFMAAFIGNMTHVRRRAVAAFSALGQVDVFGAAGTGRVQRKSEIARNYRFVLCFENDLFPGYVTEKVVEAWASGAVPIWWGLDPLAYINQDAVVNVAAHPSLDSAVRLVGQINHNADLWHEMTTSPLLNRSPDLEPALLLIRRALDRGETHLPGPR
jgi:hypothetical protein